MTLDTWLLGWRPRDLQHAYLPFLKGEGVANYFSDPVFRAALARTPEEDPAAAIGHWAQQFANPRVTWADLPWLRDALDAVLEEGTPDPAETVPVGCSIKRRP